jgi:VWFA-related protein
MKYVIAAALVFCVAAQDASFDVESRLVLVPANITDAKGHTVAGLEAGDFQVLDNGRPQKAAVDSFATGVAPIALVIAVQSSGISIPVLRKVQKIGAMIQPIITGERGCAAVLGFAQTVRWYQECTADPDLIERALFKLQAGDPKSGRMIDAVNQAIEHLRKRPNVRRVLLLISESRDRGSETDLNDAIVAAQTAGVTVYAATYSAYKTAFTIRPSEDLPRAPVPERPPVPPADPIGPAEVPPTEQRVDLLGGIGELARLGKVKTTEALTIATGGASFPFTRLKGLEGAIQKLGADLHTQYLLSFTPENPTPGYHTIEVRVLNGDYRIRARPGYWSAQKQ